MRWSSSWSSVAAWGSTFGWISQRGPGGEACISDFERQALDSDIWPNRKITDVVKEQVWIWFWEKSQANGMLVASCPLPTSTALEISDSLLSGDVSRSLRRAESCERLLSCALPHPTPFLTYPENDTYWIVHLDLWGKEQSPSILGTTHLHSHIYIYGIFLK